MTPLAITDDQWILIGLASFFVFLGFVGLARLTWRNNRARWQTYRIGVFLEREDKPHHAADTLHRDQTSRRQADEHPD